MPILTKCLADAIPDQCVDLDCVHVVELLQRLLDLPLVRSDIHDEHQCVVLLNLLHRALGVEGMDDDLASIETWLLDNRFTWIFWCTREGEGLWSVEGRAKTDLSSLVRVDL